MDLDLIADNLIKIRKKHKLKRSDLGKLINYAQSSVWNYENKVCEPKLCYIYRISKQFNISIDDILNKKL
jgi:transcriptional regulator with XRE-family HTH domain